MIAKVPSGSGTRRTVTTLPVQGRTLISAHRGGAELWPENSLTAFRHACGLPVESVEFDVHPTADGRVAVHHDPVLGRVVAGEGPVCNMAWRDLKQLRFKAHPDERIPLLEELIELTKPSHLSLRLELKVGPQGEPYAEIAEAAFALLAEQAMLERTLVSSFDRRYLETVGRLQPGLHRIWLVRPRLVEEMGLEAVIGQACALGVPEVDLRAETLKAGWPQRFADAGLTLGAFAAGERRTIERAFSLGVAMFTTDRPDLAVSIRDER